jgi:hypothetical protein
MQRLAWLLFQLVVIGGVLWLDYDAAQLFNSEPQPGFMLLVGIGLAAMLTYGLSRGWDLMFPRAAALLSGQRPVACTWSDLRARGSCSCLTHA